MTNESSPTKTGMFVLADGKNVLFIFALVSSLFFLWALGNGMIDVMDKHFQDYLHLTKSESAWVQFAHYVGYFLMAMPAGILAKKLGYKGGILAGLGLVATGCLWFIPATMVPALSHFWAFLLGVCVIAMGFTFLETIANPYTTMLGAPRYASARINLAQSFNGIGWIAGPVVGGVFFYSSKGAEAAQKTLWIPYAGIACVVLVLTILFVLTKLPDLAGNDECHVDDSAKDPTIAAEADRQIKRKTSYVLMVGNAMALLGTAGAIAGITLQILSEKTVSGANGANATTELTTVGHWVLGKAQAIADVFHAGAVIPGYAPWVFVAAIVVILYVVAAIVLVPSAKRLHSKSVWSHPHFSASTLAQFFYVAAQAGIFSFFINYIVAELPPIHGWLQNTWLLGGHAGVVQKGMDWFVNEQGATKLLSLGFFLFLTGRFSGSAILRTASPHKTLGIYAVVNIVLCAVVMMKLGWGSVLAVFGTFFFMSIMYPTIFALGIFGLASKTKTASAFIVMGITGGALMPKVMGWVGDHYNMSVSFIVPLICFVFIALYGFFWSTLSGSESSHGLKATGGH